MHRVPELNVDDEGQCRERDESFVAELCKDVFGIEHTEGDVRAVIRLGKRRDDGTSRPLLIKMKNHEKKVDIMASFKKLACAEARFTRISVTHDLTARQRETVKTAVGQAKQSADGNETENWTYKMAGPI